MTAARIRLFQVDLRPIRPLQVGGHRLDERKVLRIMIGSGHTRYVDCSPLPFFHKETFEDCFEAARAHYSGLTVALPVALSTALDALAFAFASPRSGEWENSGLLGLDSLPDSLMRMVKIKAGYHSLYEVKQFLNSVLTQSPQTQFRIDCNQLLKSADMGELKSLFDEFPIQYIEEPSSSIEVLKSLARILPIALDENLGRDIELDSLAKAWVIKPNRLGWSNTIERLSDRSDVLKVLSNTYESDASLQLYAYLYAQTVSQPQALGFGTAFYFDESKARWNPRVQKGVWPTTPFAEDEFEGTLLWES